MEIDQILEVSFSQPLITKEVTPTEIDINIKDERLSYDCCYELDSPSLNNWNNTLEINYSSSETSQSFIFQYGKNKILGKNEITCNYEIGKVFYHLKKGVYKFKEGASLGKDNKFKLDVFQNRQFSFYGNDDISPIYYSDYFVSQIGSKIVFAHEYNDNDEALPPIYMVNGSYIIDSLKKCDNIKTSTKLPYNLAYCEITADDLNNLEKVNAELSLYYQLLCRYYQYSYMNLTKLDTKNYPVFNIIEFLKPTDAKLTKETDLILVSNVTGASKFHNNDENIFHILLEVENGNANKTYHGYCGADYSSENVQSNLTCHLNITSEEISYNNIYLLPYHLIMKAKTPFDVIIKDTMKAGEKPTPEPPKPTGLSSYLKYSIGLSLTILLLLF